MRFLIVSCALVAGFTAYTSHAGTESHGGSTVVCFDRDPYMESAPYISNGRINATGEAAIQKVETLEYFRAKLVGKWNPKVVALITADSKTAYEGLRKLLVGVPSFWVALDTGRAAFGEIESNAIAAPYGIQGVSDTDLLPLMPEECAIVQTVLRQKHALYVYPTVWNLMNGFQRALLQLHEEVYFVASPIPGIPVTYPTSLGTQLLIAYILTQSYTDQDLVDQLQVDGFSASYTRSQVVAKLDESITKLSQIKKWVEKDPSVCAGVSADSFGEISGSVFTPTEVGKITELEADYADYYDWLLRTNADPVKDYAAWWVVRSADKHGIPLGKAMWVCSSLNTLRQPNFMAEQIQRFVDERDFWANL